jgi:hypothetical protein
MSSTVTVIVIVVVILIAASLAFAAVTARRRKLQQQFGPEYDRAVTEQSSRLRAEAELTDRQRRVRKLDIRPLTDAARQQYAADWVVIQEQFVDSPRTAVARAYDLVVSVMTDRGYPTDDTEQVMADLSVEHAETVGHFRAAQQITTAAASGDAATEDLRQALIHYRALFADLLGVHDAATGRGMNGSAPADGALTGNTLAAAPTDTDPDGNVVDGNVIDDLSRDEADTTRSSQRR